MRLLEGIFKDSLIKEDFSTSMPDWLKNHLRLQSDYIKMDRDYYADGAVRGKSNFGSRSSIGDTEFKMPINNARNSEEHKTFILMDYLRKHRIDMGNARFINLKMDGDIQPEDVLRLMNSKQPSLWFFYLKDESAVYGLYDGRGDEFELNNYEQFEAIGNNTISSVSGGKKAMSYTSRMSKIIENSSDICYVFDDSARNSALISDREAIKGKVDSYLKSKDKLDYQVGKLQDAIELVNSYISEKSYWDSNEFFEDISSVSEAISKFSVEMSGLVDHYDDQELHDEHRELLKEIRGTKRRLSDVADDILKYVERYGDTFDAKDQEVIKNNIEGCLTELNEVSEDIYGVKKKVDSFVEKMESK